MDADRRDAACLDRAEKACHAVDEGLAADEADILVPLGLPQEMLARAEANLEPDPLDGFWKERRNERTWRRFCEVEAEPGQECGNQPLFARGQWLGVAPAVRAGRCHEVDLCLLTNHAPSCPALSRASTII